MEVLLGVWMTGFMAWAAWVSRELITIKINLDDLTRGKRK